MVTAAPPTAAPPRNLRLEWVDPATLDDNPRNWRKHPQGQADALRDLILGDGGVGWAGALLYNERTGRLIDGHGRKKIGAREVPVLVGAWDEAQERTILATLDPLAGMAQADTAALDTLLRDVDSGSTAVQSLLSDLAAENGLYREGATGGAGVPKGAEAARRALADRFVVPPFSVLDARQGYWQARKNAWIDLGIKGELGRDDNALGESEGVNQRHATGAGPYGRPRASSPGRSSGQDLMHGEHVVGQPTEAASAFKSQRRQAALQKTGDSRMGNAPINSVFGRAEDAGSAQSQTGTSVFDPVLCELAYRWFAPDGGHVLDPFAGEATKGIVATYLGYAYTGVELRPEQVTANEAQAREIGVAPTWRCGDSARLDALLPAGARYDLIFTSPPYYDLEVYSADEKDGSAFETYEKFMAWYRVIFAQAVARLRDHRFVVVKVGEVRDRRGVYRNFLGDNIACFRDLGLHYYNEAVLVTAVGSLPVRVGRQFSSGRKLGKTHQNVLVFFKGNVRRIKDEFPQGLESGDLVGLPAQDD